MSFLAVYSLILATIFTLSVMTFSCSYCIYHHDFQDDEIPESVKHIYS